MKPGGNIIIVSECSEGLGSAEFVDSQSRLVNLGPEAFLKSLLEKPRADVDEWQTEMQLRPMGVAQINLFSRRLSIQDKTLTAANCQENNQTADEFIANIIGSSATGDIAIIPEGPYVIPRFNP